MGCVSWNMQNSRNTWKHEVAPRMGCVSWNSNLKNVETTNIRRTPHGVCELKCKESLTIPNRLWSHPAWGVWVEISDAFAQGGSATSHPAWGVWVEIQFIFDFNAHTVVAPRMGCVSWNCVAENFSGARFVAPRMGCVSWNSGYYTPEKATEGRTPHGVCELKWRFLRCDYAGVGKSHPAWGVWVEI